MNYNTEFLMRDLISTSCVALNVLVNWKLCKRMYYYRPDSWQWSARKYNREVFSTFQESLKMVMDATCLFCFSFSLVYGPLQVNIFGFS